MSLSTAATIELENLPSLTDSRSVKVGSMSSISSYKFNGSKIITSFGRSLIFSYTYKAVACFKLSGESTSVPTSNNPEDKKHNFKIVHTVKIMRSASIEEMV